VRSQSQYGPIGPDRAAPGHLLAAEGIHCQPLTTIGTHRDSITMDWRRTRDGLLWAGVALAAVLNGLPAAAADGRIDGQTGREMAVYPPARHFDHRHMRLEIDIPDMSVPMFRARQTLTMEAIGAPRGQVEVDAAPPPNLRVEAVSLGGRSLEFRHEARATSPESPRHHGTTGVLRISLPEPVAPGATINIQIDYEANYPEATGTGLTWSAGDPAGAGETDRWAQIHSQGQPQHNHRWFPCHDFPNDRLTTELLVTVEDPYIVGSNGRLVSTRLATPSASGRSRTTWHWLQDRPHPAYLVSLVVGRFSIVAITPPAPEGATVNLDGRPVQCTLLTPIGAEQSAAAAFSNTPAMVNFFSEVFGHPYPWAKYSTAFVREFAWGGMENTSATTVREEFAYSEPGEEDDLIAHEIAHQWTGNLVTTRSWEHLWLNEGWASYSEALWAEHQASAEGGPRQRRAYQRKIAGFLTVQRATNRTTAPGFPPMVSNRYTDPEETFLKANDVYARGAVVLHMLRQKIGDEAFFGGTRLYINRFAFGEVETDDFRRCMEETSGLSLERFFAQWCYRPGLPRLEIAMEWTEAADGDEDAAGGGELRIIVNQVQQIDADNPAYAFTLPVHIRTEAGTKVRMIEMDTRQAVARYALASKPTNIIIDPDMTVAAFTRITKRLAMWIDQLHAPADSPERGEGTYFAHLDAIEHLSTVQEMAAVVALAAFAADPDHPAELRRLAGRAGAAAGRRIAAAFASAAGARYSMLIPWTVPVRALHD
jgi:aminopeptidase N